MLSEMTVIPRSTIRNPNSKGFTLIEIVITIVLVTILSGLAAVIMLQGVKAYSTEQSRSNVHYQTRAAMERITREARVIRSCDDLATSLTSTSTLSFIDINGNPVSFNVNAVSGILSRITDTLATGITSTRPFSFLASDLTATDACPGVWYVEINLADTQGPASLQMRTRVHPRNF
jgi:prepilin-type N-terminal cleavage/methylation domain-containing protein